MFNWKKKRNVRHIEVGVKRKSHLGREFETNENSDRIKLFETYKPYVDKSEGCSPQESERINSGQLSFSVKLRELSCQET